MAIENLDQNTGGTRTMAGEFDSRLTVDAKLDQIMAAVTVAGAKPASELCADCDHADENGCDR